VTFKSIIRTWLPLAFRFIIRHRRKTVANSCFIIAGTAILVLLHGITVGINDAMILNTTSIHYGHAFMEVPPGAGPEKIAADLSGSKTAEKVLLRYRFTSLLRKDAAIIPSVVYAVEPEKESVTTAVAGRIIDGRYPSGSAKEILMGAGTAERLNAKTGDTVTIIEGRSGTAGDFIVSGIFRTRIERLDEGVSYIPEQALDHGMKINSTAELSVFITPGTDISAAERELDRTVPPGLSLKTWEQLMPDLVQLIRMNGVSTKIIMTLVFVLVGFGIGNNFIMTIVERFRELGILRAMGATPGELILLVFLENFLLCLLATFAGLAAGWLLSAAAAYHGIDLGAFTSHNQYFVVSGVVHPRVTLSGLYMPALIAIVISAVSSYIPTRIAAGKITVETLRFE